MSLFGELEQLVRKYNVDTQYNVPAAEIVAPMREAHKAWVDERLETLAEDEPNDDEDEDDDEKESKTEAKSDKPPAAAAKKKTK